jgi:hypothetical protein
MFEVTVDLEERSCFSVRHLIIVGKYFQNPVFSFIKKHRI